MNNRTQNPNIEHRVYDFRVEKREDDSRQLVGHAAVFNRIGDGFWFREQVAPGAFATSIKEDDVRALFNHDPNYVLGRNTSGTLVMREDKEGLHVEIDPPDTQWARDLITSIERGDISQMSFGFEVKKESWERGEDNEPDLRTLEEVKLWDVSPVTFPFYLETDIAVRNHEAWLNERQEVPRFKTDILRRKLNLKLRIGGSL